MNRNRMILLGIVALACALGVTFISYRMMQGQKSQYKSIVVAKKRLPVGYLITAQDIVMASWPDSLPLEGTIAELKKAENRGVLVEMLANEPLLESKLAVEGIGAGLISKIPPGMRAVSVKVDNVIGVAYFVLPDTYVDVILTGQPCQNEEPTSKIIVENVRVLAADKALENVEQDPKDKKQVDRVQVVTLLVTPEQAQKIALASTDGRIQLALRNPLEQKQIKVTPAAIQRPELYTGKAQPLLPCGQARPASTPSAAGSSTAPKKAVVTPTVLVYSGNGKRREEVPVLRR
jgi:pilus assembly protein CpaB